MKFLTPQNLHSAQASAPQPHTSRIGRKTCLPSNTLLQAKKACGFFGFFKGTAAFRSTIRRRTATPATGLTAAAVPVSSPPPREGPRPVQRRLYVSATRPSAIHAAGPGLPRRGQAPRAAPGPAAALRALLAAAAARHGRRLPGAARAAGRMRAEAVRWRFQGRLRSARRRRRPGRARAQARLRLPPAQRGAPRPRPSALPLPH